MIVKRVLICRLAEKVRKNKKAAEELGIVVEQKNEKE